MTLQDDPVEFVQAMPTLLPIPALADNYIWLLRGGGECWLVDPGDADAAVAGLDPGEVPAGVLITHHHPDHIGGVARLHERFRCQVLAPDDHRIPLATRRVGEGDQLRLAGDDWLVWALPGHTLSHVGYVHPQRLLCGDTLFSLGCGRLFEGSPQQMLATLDRLATLADDCAVHCSHEYTLANAAFALAVEPDNPSLLAYLAELAAAGVPQRPSLPSQIGRERACNPFLRIDQAGVRRSLTSHFGQCPADRAEAWALLRHWKDGFRG